MNKYILFQELRPFCKNFRTIANPAAGIVSESDFKARYMKMTKLVWYDIFNKLKVFHII